MNNLDNDKLYLEIYKDLAQPSIREIGKTLGCIVRYSIGVEPNKKRLQWLKNNLIKTDKKLSVKLSEGKRINENPRLNIALPILESFSLIEDEILTDMFSELLAKELTREESLGVLPSFINILKNITSDEAKILKLFKEGTIIDQKYILENEKPHKGYIANMPAIKIVHRHANKRTSRMILKNYSPPLYELAIIHNNIPAYLDNLISLGIIMTSLDNSIGDATRYGSTISILDYDSYVLNHPSYQEIIADNNIPDINIGLEHGYGQLTDFGEKFLEACGY